MLLAREVPRPTAASARRSEYDSAAAVVGSDRALALNVEIAGSRRCHKQPPVPNSPLTHYNAFNRIANVSNLVPWFSFCLVLVILASHFRARMDLPKKKSHLESGLNQRDRATGGFCRNYTHRKPIKVFYCRGFGHAGKKFHFRSAFQVLLVASTRQSHVRI